MRHVLASGLALAIAAVVCVARPHAQDVSAEQIVSRPLEIPKGTAKPGFDLARLNTENYGSFVPFFVKETQPLSEAQNRGLVAADTPVVVTETAGGRLALLTDQMAYHHTAQGRAGGKDWLATF